MLRKTFLLSVLGLICAVPIAQADIDGHGPDAWRVTGVSASDTLNVRMGPGTNFPVIERFAHNERDLQQITCVPFYNAAHYTALTQAQIAALPPRWCLMRTAAMDRAGWVAQRFITPEGQVAEINESAPDTPYATQGASDDKLVGMAWDLVYEMYDRLFVSEISSDMASPLDPSVAHKYFTEDIVAWLASGDVGAHPLYGAQDFDGTVSEPMADTDNPMYRGMITMNVDIVNFGKPQRAVFYLRADTTKAGAPLRIFRVEHDGWSYP